MVRTLSIAVLAAAVPLSGLGAQLVHGQEEPEAARFEDGSTVTMQAERIDARGDTRAVRSPDSPDAVSPD